MGQTERSNYEFPHNGVLCRPIPKT